VEAQFFPRSDPLVCAVDRFRSVCFGLPLSVAFQQRSVLIKSSIAIVVCTQKWAVSLNRALNKTVPLILFGPKRDGVKREWRKLHNEELDCLYWSPSIVRVIKSKIMRWTGHVARMKVRGEVHTGFSWGN